jgi:hypothetical protein
LSGVRQQIFPFVFARRALDTANRDDLQERRLDPVSGDDWDGSALDSLDPVDGGALLPSSQPRQRSSCGRDRVPVPCGGGELRLPWSR